MPGQKGTMMDSKDSALVNDPRTLEVAEVSGMSPTEVVETAEEFARLNGDTVTEELDNAAAVADAITLLDSGVELGDEDDTEDDEDEDPDSI